MRIETCHLFAQLCEGVLAEVSSSLDLVKNQPGGQEVIQYLHKSQGLGHDIKYGPVEKISWSDLKNAYRGAWVIIQGTKGVAAIKASQGSYHSVASAGGEPETFNNDRGGNNIDFIKSKIGKLTKFYVGTNTTAVSDKLKKRREYRAQAQKGGLGNVTTEYLIEKFRPMWIKAMEAAIVSLRGHIVTMIKNDAFSKAKKKLDYIERLENQIDEIRRGSTEAPGIVKKTINYAVLMTAAHYYPEQTGALQRPQYARGDDLQPQFEEGPKMLLKDISNGDMKKLGTILGFFKRVVISG